MMLQPIIIDQFEELGLYAEIIGRHEGKDFSFVARKGKSLLRVTVEHIKTPGSGVVADIRPASRYGDRTV